MKIDDRPGAPIQVCATLSGLEEVFRRDKPPECAARLWAEVYNAFGVKRKKGHAAMTDFVCQSAAEDYRFRSSKTIRLDQADHDQLVRRLEKKEI